MVIRRQNEESLNNRRSRNINLNNIDDNEIFVSAMKIDFKIIYSVLIEEKLSKNMNLIAQS